METSSSENLWWNEAIEVIEATEVVNDVEVIEAAEVSDAREITQHVKCKVSFSPKRHKKAKSDEKKNFKKNCIWYIKTAFKDSFFSFLCIILKVFY